MEQKEYVCEKCNYKTAFKSSYDQHLETELHKTGKRKTRTDKKILDKCPHCEYASKINTDMQTHIILKHMTEEEQKKNFFIHSN
jgi:DNA-directed RNA polymerase subunit RPC12/RpoP